jgi:hypothetical protein
MRMIVIVLTGIKIAAMSGESVPVSAKLNPMKLYTSEKIKLN